MDKVAQDFILFFRGEGVMATSPPLHPFATSIRFLPADISWYDMYIPYIDSSSTQPMTL